MNLTWYENIFKQSLENKESVTRNQPNPKRLKSKFSQIFMSK